MKKLNETLKKEFPNKSKRRRMIKMFKSGKLAKEIDKNYAKNLYEEYQNDK
jgi:endonuclease V-like protein UPF0215 family